MFVFSSRKTLGAVRRLARRAGRLMLAAARRRANHRPVQLGPVSVSDNADKNGLNHAPPLASMPIDQHPGHAAGGQCHRSATMKQQAITTLGDALRNVPGITIAIGEGGTLAGDQFKIRGFDAKDDVYLDGLRDFGAYTRDSFNYEEVQVLKGPSGLMFGRGTTGGAINTISKTPFLKDRYSAALEGGNGDHVRATADLNYAFSDTGAVRLNLMYTDTGVVDRDFAHATRWGIAPTIALGLGTDTQWSLAYMHQHTDAHPDYGLAVAQRPGQLIAEPVSEYGVPRNTNTRLQHRHRPQRRRHRHHEDRPSGDALADPEQRHPRRRLFALFPVHHGRHLRIHHAAQYRDLDQLLLGGAVRPGDADIGGGHRRSPHARWARSAAAVPISRTAGACRMSPPPRPISISAASATSRSPASMSSYQNADRTIYAYRLPTTGAIHLSAGRPHGEPPQYRHLAVTIPPISRRPAIRVIYPTAATIAGSNDTATSVVTSSGNATDLAFFATDRFYFTPEISVIGGVRVDRYTAHLSPPSRWARWRPDRRPRRHVRPRPWSIRAPPWCGSRPRTRPITSPRASRRCRRAPRWWVRPRRSPPPTRRWIPEMSETLEVGAKKSFFDGALGLSAARCSRCSRAMP